MGGLGGALAAEREDENAPTLSCVWGNTRYWLEMLSTSPFLREEAHPPLVEKKNYKSRRLKDISWLGYKRGNISRLKVERRPVTSELIACVHHSRSVSVCPFFLIHCMEGRLLSFFFYHSQMRMDTCDWKSGSNSWMHFLFFVCCCCCLVWWWWWRR